jgi:AraC-like DNA-binding protein
MKINRYQPSFLLKPFVREFLIIESDQATQTQTLPDTALVMSFRYKGKVDVIPPGCISGLRKVVRTFNYQQDTGNVLVIFNPGGLHAFCRIPAHEIFGQSISSENVFSCSELQQVSERLANAGNDLRIQIVEGLLLKKLKHLEQDSVVMVAVDTIQQHYGSIRIKKLAADLHISQDPFEKRFRATIGATPKQYASIIRLQHLIKNYRTSESLTEAAYQAGYFDQSHFIKDFRLFTGKSPKAFFQSSLYW